MRKYLLPRDGNFYKANMHSHSNWSDGHYSPGELKDLYKSRGYSVLAITDHEGLFYHEELNDEDFLTIAGCELEFNGKRGKDYNDWAVAHLCVYKKDPREIFQIGYDYQYRHEKFAFLREPEKYALLRSVGDVLSKEYSAENINHVIKSYRDAGFIVTLNHPKWSCEEYEAYIQYEGLHCLEIYNHTSFTSGHDEDNGDVYDCFLKKGKRLWCTATDDCHRSLEHPHEDMFGGYIMLKAETLSYERIMDAFESGNFYSSTGPEIADLYVEDGRICVKTRTPVKMIRFLTGNRYVKAVYDKNGGDIYGGEFELRGNYQYCRIELIDGCGKKAYTNAYFQDRLSEA